MAFQPCPGCAAVDIVWEEGGNTMENAINLMHVDGSAFTLAQLSAALAVINTWITTWAAPRMSTAYTLLHLEARGLDAADSPITTGFGGANGTQAGNQLPNNVTIALKLLTGKAGRSNHGRFYWIGLLQSHQTGDTYDTTELAAIVTALDHLRSAIDGIDANTGLAVLSRYSGVDPVTHKPIKRAHGVPSFVTGTAVTDNVLDSQRRRLIGHNAHR